MTKDEKEIMQQMKRVWNVGYSYSFRDKELNKRTRFIFSIKNFDELMQRLLIEFPEWNRNQDEYVLYAITRWYKYLSANFSESVFTKFPNVIKATPEQDTFDHIDFFIDEVPFDLKNVVFPKSYGKSYKYALRNPNDFLVWLLDKQGGKEFKQRYQNQLFLIFVSSFRPEWRMKAEFPLIERAVKKWMKHYKMQRLDRRINGHSLKADLIWVVE